MKSGITAVLLGLLALPAWCLGPNQAVADEQGSAGLVEDQFLSGRMAGRQVYGDVELGFSLTGPTGWSGRTRKSDDADPLPPGVVQVFRKEYEGQPPPTPSKLMLLIVHPAQPRMPLEALGDYLSDTPSATLVARPTQTVIGAKTWATAELRDVVETSQGERVVRTKAYATTHRGATIYIIGMSMEEEYEQNRPLFDGAVEEAAFTDGALSDMLIDVIEKEIGQQQDNRGQKN